jgi:hypothetical protein
MRQSQWSRLARLRRAMDEAKARREDAGPDFLAEYRERCRAAEAEIPALIAIRHRMDALAADILANVTVPEGASEIDQLAILRRALMANEEFMELHFRYLELGFMEQDECIPPAWYDPNTYRVGPPS